MLSISCLHELGNGALQKELVHNDVVCDVYYSTGSRTIPSLRWEVFRTRNLEGEMLPPTHAALLPHIICAN